MNIKNLLEREKPRSRIERKALHLRVLDLLLEDIEAGRYLPGSKFPSEEKLARELSISRVTLREALRSLEEYGLISRLPGVGTFVREKKVVPVQDLSKIISISSIFKKVGLEDQFTKIKYKQTPANRIIAKKLQLHTGDEVWEVERLRTINGRTAIYSFDYFPGFLVPTKEKENFKLYTNNIYKFLIEVCEQIIEEGECTLKPIVADKSLSSIMNIPQYTPLVYIETTDVNQDQQPALHAREYYLPDFFEFRVIRRRKVEEREPF